MTQAVDIIKSAYRRIAAYQSGEQLAPLDAKDALETFNDLLDSMSTDKDQIYGTNEAILSWSPGKIQYKVGNPTCTSLGIAPFTGTITSGSTIINGVTQIPTGLTAGTSLNGVGAGSTITDLQAIIPAGTYVTSIGSNTVQLSQAATANSNGSDQFTFTLPGDFPIPRPLRITYGFTRINQLDFDFKVYGTQEEYLAVLYKFQPGPWPVLAWYNNVMPYGLLNVYQAPGQAGELHLFTDTILSNLTLNQTLVVPQGYVRWLKWKLAIELWPEYWGAMPIPEALKRNEQEAGKQVQELNARPAKVSVLDRELVRGNRPDGGWVTHGGYR